MVPLAPDGDEALQWPLTLLRSLICASQADEALQFFAENRDRDMRQPYPIDSPASASSSSIVSLGQAMAD